MNVVWFKRDLRLADHAPLAAAIDRGEPLLLLYIVEPTLLRDPHYRGRHWHFIAQSLQAMNNELAMLGAQIHILEGEPVTLLNTLHQSQPISHLYSHEETGLGVTFERDRQVAAFCAAQGIAWHEYQTNGIQRGRRDRRGWNRAWQRVMSDAEIPVDLNALPQLCQPAPCCHGGRTQRANRGLAAAQRGVSARRCRRRATRCCKAFWKCEDTAINAISQSPQGAGFTAHGYHPIWRGAI